VTVQTSPTRSARILFDTEVLDTWHPLDRVPAPEYIPPTWDGPHCGKRLVDGLRTLALMPRVNGPRGPTNSWPLYAHSWEDLLAQEEAAEEDKRQNQHEANRTRVRPSSVEIARMEQSICWPARYLREFPQLVRTVQAVAVARSRDRDMDHAARRLRLPRRVVRRRNAEGLDLIARELHSDRVRVF
jgi:hypothetical protein